ncbi:MAG: family 10 glycosylhydrolase [Armatimonadetes bacterium]|nr:family 10 glycosylhydrolase [Armatimonadota bacterium]
MMKARGLGIATLALLSLGAAFAQKEDGGGFSVRNNSGLFIDGPTVVPTIRREMRAAWVATVYNIDWPSTASLSTTSQKNEVIALLDLCAELKMNAVFVQVRSQADALFQSSIEPWAPCLKSPMGTGPNPVYDPLAYWVTEAHKRGIEVHAWFNPYRALASSTLTTPSNHITKTNPSECDTYGTAVWIDPSSTFGQNRLTQVINDVVNRYDVDGVCFDDYFYPSPISGTPYPDSTAYAAYQAGGGTMTLADWRRDNVNTMVQNVGIQIKLIKPWVKFGIGPNGIWKNNNPPGVVGQQAYSELYADTRRFLHDGWVDYLAPQLYWLISAPQQSYADLTAWWADPAQNPLGRNVYVSNYTSQLGGTNASWTSDEILNQIDITRTTTGASGNVHYSIKALKNNYKGVKDALKAGPYATWALIPPNTWIDSVPPSKPNLTYTFSPSTGRHLFTWSPPSGSESPTWYVVSYLIGSNWTQTVYTPTTTSMQIAVKNSGAALRAFGVASVDRSGNMSPVAQRVFDASVYSGGGNIGRD